MPWNKNDYPNSMKNLDEDVREKAIEIANALLDEGYEDGKAIPIAIDRAKMWEKIEKMGAVLKVSKMTFRSNPPFIKFMHKKSPGAF
ncbi:DUF2188 domain-containing protein [Peribacillus simplex]|uniref:DUF2188 domain-containing protein n=2 Tax=Peribacillus TaxID=2675229 RepID=A0AA90PGI3_9BACI|nr:MULTISPECIES: DUF2188 domain-containing protein [Peribacillus]MDP1419842.1 DUF2188 domain-containing protein [Peribacillus simplex]MDP1454071.1 DUF2188 domain-containing protein [Peribacillus frigoritolerans]